METYGGGAPWLGKLRGLGIWSPDNDLYGFVPCDGSEESRKRIIDAVKTWKEGTVLVGHNAKYELHWLGFTREDLKRFKLFDTMVAEHLLQEEYSKDLGSLEARYLQTTTKKSLLALSEDYGGIQRIDNWPFRLVAEYCKNDCRITYLVAERQTALLKAQGMASLFGRQMHYLKALYAIEARGLVLDLQHRQTTVEKAELLLERAAEAIEVELRKYNAEPLKTYNSPKAVSKLLYETLGIPKPQCPESLKKSPKAKAYASTCTGKDLLKQLNHPVPALILEWKSIKILIGYMTSYMKFQEPASQSQFAHTFQGIDDLDAKYSVIHSTFNQTGTVTGRLSSVRPNLQQVKAKYAGQKYDTEKDDEGKGIGFGVRPIFCARPGFKLASIDYKQMEVVVFAALSKDEKLLEIVQAGGDAHELTAADMSTPTSPVTRKDAKTINFGVLYGLGIPGLAALLGTNEDVAGMKYAAYLNHYKGVRPWMNQVAMELLNYGYVTYWSGRKRRIPHKSLHYRGVNALVQGGCADIVAEATVAIDKYLGDLGYDDGIVAIIHDEFLVELRDDEYLDAKIQNIQNLMAVPHAVGIPLLTDVETGFRWNAASDNEDRTKYKDGLRDFLDKEPFHKQPKMKKAYRNADDFSELEELIFGESHE